MTENGKPGGWFPIDNGAVDVLLPRVGFVAFGVYAYLAYRAGSSRRCWPSVERIAIDLGLSARAVRKHLRRLEEAGAITTQGRQGGASVYTLTPLNGAEPGFRPSHEGRNVRSGLGGTAVPGLGGTAVPPEQQPIEQQPENNNPARAAPGGEPRKRPEEIEIPEALASEPFTSAWRDWLAYRRERRLTLTPRTLTAQLAKLAPLGPAGAADCIRDSIANGWQGLFPHPERRSNSIGRPSRPHRVGPGQRFDPDAAKRNPNHGRM